MQAKDIFPKVIRPQMELDSAAYLEHARFIARKLCMTQGTTNIDEVRALCPPPGHVDPRLMGAVFNGDFESVGYTKSKRKRCHGRPISVFKLKGAE